MSADVSVERFDRNWRARCMVRHAQSGELDAMVKRHYLRKPPGVVTCSLLMACDFEPVGMLIFALPPIQTSTRYGAATWELARLWISDEIPSNAETWLISKALRHVRNLHRAVEVVVSYADPSAGHSGTIYSAANFISDGMTDDDRKTPRFDYVVDGKKYSRRSHVPAGVIPERAPRVSKTRWVYRLRPAAEEAQP